MSHSNSNRLSICRPSHSCLQLQESFYVLSLCSFNAVRMWSRLIGVNNLLKSADQVFIQRTNQAKFYRFICGHTVYSIKYPTIFKRLIETTTKMIYPFTLGQLVLVINIKMKNPRDTTSNFTIKKYFFYSFSFSLFYFDSSK